MAAEVLTFLLPSAGVMTGALAARAAGLCPAGRWLALAAGWPPLVHAASSRPAAPVMTASPRPRRWADFPIPHTMGLAVTCYRRSAPRTGKAAAPRRLMFPRHPLFTAELCPCSRQAKRRPVPGRVR